MSKMNISLLNFKREFDQVGAEIMVDLGIKISQGKYILQQDVIDFERDFSLYCGVGHTVGVASGTAALHLALLTLGIKAGDEVITTSLSFNATAQAIVYTGAKPVFVDVDPETGLIDLKKIANKISKKTKAVLPVHLYGMAADLDGLVKLCEEEDLYLVEDCAQAHGTLYNSKKVGTFGELGCFSFMPAKNLGAYGDAGAVITNNKEFADHLVELRNHGRREKYLHHMLGYAERIDNIQAVILRHKLQHLDSWNLSRREVAKKYYAGLSTSIRHLKLDPKVYATYYGFNILVNNRDELQKKLGDQGIETNCYYPLPLHRQPVFKNYNYYEKEFSSVNTFCNQVMSIPMNPFLNDNEIEYIIENVNRYAK